jgi:hypothetical protein
VDELDLLLPEEPGVWGASPPARELGVLGMLRMIAALAKPATTPRLPNAQLWVAPWPQNRGGETEVWFVRNGDSVYALFPF